MAKLFSRQLHHSYLVEFRMSQRRNQPGRSREARRKVTEPEELEGEPSCAAGCAHEVNELCAAASGPGSRVVRERARSRSFCETHGCHRKMHIVKELVRLFGGRSTLPPSVLPDLPKPYLLESQLRSRDPRQPPH